MLSAGSAAGRGGRGTDEPAAVKGPMNSETISASNDDPVRLRQTRKVDHGVDKLLLCGSAIGLGHHDALNGRQAGLRSSALKCVVGTHRCAIGSEGTAVQAEFKNVRRVNNGLWTVAVFKEREFNGCGSVDEQAAEQAALFLGDPVATAVLADQDDVGAARWRFGLFHFHSR